MHTRKAALVGCAQGPWVNTSRMRGLKLEVKGAGKIRVDQRWPEHESISNVEGAGFHQLFDAEWARVSVVEGDPSSVLCFLTTEG